MARELIWWIYRARGGKPEEIARGVRGSHWPLGVTTTDSTSSGILSDSRFVSGMFWQTSGELIMDLISADLTPIWLQDGTRPFVPGRPPTVEGEGHIADPPSIMAGSQYRPPTLGHPGADMGHSYTAYYQVCSPNSQLIHTNKLKQSPYTTKQI